MIYYVTKYQNFRVILTGQHGTRSKIKDCAWDVLPFSLQIVHVKYIICFTFVIFLYTLNKRCAVSGYYFKSHLTHTFIFCFLRNKGLINYSQVYCVDYQYLWCLVWTINIIWVQIFLCFGCVYEFDQPWTSVPILYMLYIGSWLYKPLCYRHYERVFFKFP